jgi:regulator of sigma E protease
VFWLFTVLLSLNLGMVNLLPFPALDGGRLIFLVYELIFRCKPSPRWERAAHSLGFLLLLALIIFLSFQDIGKIFS